MTKSNKKRASITTGKMNGSWKQFVCALPVVAVAVAVAVFAAQQQPAVTQQAQTTEGGIPPHTRTSPQADQPTKKKTPAGPSLATVPRMPYPTVPHLRRNEE